MARPTVEQFAEEVTAALGPRLVALVLYGSAARGTDVPARSDRTTLLVCDAVDEDLFARLGRAVRSWTRAGHPPPIIFTEREWRESAEAFPIEYEDMRQHSRLLAGRDAWPASAVDRARVRWQLAHELLGKTVRLRQAYAALREDPKRLARALAGSAGGFLTMLRATLRLAGRTPPATADALVEEAGALVGFAPQALAALVAHSSGHRALTLARGDPLPAAYLEAVARTAEFVNRPR